MWEAIRANRRRSMVLIGVMGAILVLLGFLIGAAIFGPDAGALGAIAALAVWLVMLIAALAGGEQIVMATAKAREIKKQDAPQLWNVVEEMTIASGLGKMPRIYIVDNDMPNAFAAGRKPEVSCVAVTSGLLRRLNRDELQGVIAHEIGHIKNLDVRFMTIAAVMLGSIVILSDMFLRMLWYGGGRRRGKGGQEQIVILLIAIAAAVLAPIFAQILYFACSRSREYLADASAARFTRYPEGLASALEKITGYYGRSKKKRDVPRAIAPMYIVNPLQASSAATGLFSTHPPAAKRVAVLRAMGGMAGWVDYERAYRKVTGQKRSGIDQRTLSSEQSIAARKAAEVKDAKQDASQRGREVADLIDRLVGFLLIACPCGVRIKVPPNLKKDAIRCTRCGRDHPVPRPGSEQPAPDSPAAEQSAPDAPLRYTRKGEGWETIRCSCGATQQIGPTFAADSIACRNCRRKIEIVGP